MNKITNLLKKFFVTKYKERTTEQRVNSLETFQLFFAITILALIILLKLMGVCND